MNDGMLSRMVWSSSNTNKTDIDNYVRIKV